tara:strand:- start:95 stop:205 length:111 start_codon:yes stop_codon:yes gene_type:complete
MGRIAGLQVFRIVFFKLNWGLFGQDCRIAGFTGLLQ